MEDTEANGTERRGTEAQGSEAQGSEPQGTEPRQWGITLLWAAIGVAAVVLVVLVALALRTPRITNVEPAPGELTPATALLTATRRPVIVAGYVFWREGLPPQLCEGTYSTRPPLCAGPSLNIEGFDINRLDLRRAKDGPTDVAWSEAPFRFRGTLRTAHFDVTEVLS